MSSLLAEIRAGIYIWVQLKTRSVPDDRFSLINKNDENEKFPERESMCVCVCARKRMKEREKRASQKRNFLNYHKFGKPTKNATPVATSPPSYVAREPNAIKLVRGI